jgi:photosystem P840 reaction center iron-sulfur protein
MRKTIMASDEQKKEATAAPAGEAKPAAKSEAKPAAKTAAKPAGEAKPAAKTAAKPAAAVKKPAPPPPIDGAPNRLMRPKTAAPKKKRDKQIYTIIEELCIGCGFCTDECPPKVNAILPRDVEAVLDGGETYWIDQSRCISCSLCFVAGTCPTDAVVFTEGGVSRTQYMEEYMHIEMKDTPYWKERSETARITSVD